MQAVFLSRPAAVRRARPALLACVLGLALVPAFAQKRLAACDILDEKQASAVLRGAIEARSSNRDFEQAGKATSSWCQFAAARSNLRVQLFEYPDAAGAAAAARQVVSRKGEAVYTEEKGLGDQAWWWAMGDEKARGYIVRKGARILVLDVRSEERVSEKDAKQLLRPRMPDLVGRL